jgi:Fe-S oxidoreductase
MFVEDYLELKLPGAAEVKARCFLFEDFIDRLLEREPKAIAFNVEPQYVAIHAHCHAKSLLNPAFMMHVIQRMPGRMASVMNTGCCGMAGAFGALKPKYELSIKIAQPLLAQIKAQPAGAIIVASGTSCRHQLEHLSTGHFKHIAEVLAAGLKN